MTHVRLANGYAHVTDDDPSDPSDYCYDCCKPAATPLTRQGALRAAVELLLVALRLKTDAQEAAEWEAECARAETEEREPVRIPGFNGPFSRPGVYAEIKFGEEPDE